MTATAITAHLRSCGVRSADALGSLFEDEREVETKVGRRVIAQLFPGDDFWSAWKQEKAALKKAGVSVSKFQGSWNAVCWFKPEQWAGLLADVSEQAIAPAQPSEPMEAPEANISTEQVELPEACQAEDAKSDLVVLPDEAFSAGGLTAFPAQREGVRAAVSACKAGEKAYLIADSMGSGKTLQAILTAKQLVREGEIKRVVVLAKASLCSMWLGRLHASGFQPHWITSSKQEQPPFAPEAVIVNYTLAIREKVASKLGEWIDGETMLILDEAHACKATGWTPSKISKLIWGFGKDNVGLSEEAKFTLALTGTPAPNGKHSELHGLLSAGAGVTKDYRSFGELYCGLEKQHVGRGRMVWVETANTNQSDFADLYRPMKIQRPVSAFADLPELSLTRHTMEATGEVMKAQKEMERETSFDDIASAVAAGAEPAFNQFSKVMRLIGLAKAKNAAAIIDDHVRDNGAMVVFCRHKEVHAEILADLRKRNLDVITMTSDMNGEQRGRAVERFQDGAAKVFLTTLGVAAEGITLTHAKQALIVEMDYVPGRLDQAIARIHRIGQDERCVVHQLVMTGSVDDRLIDIVNDKSEAIRKLK